MKRTFLFAGFLLLLVFGWSWTQPLNRLHLDQRVDTAGIHAQPDAPDGAITPIDNRGLETPSTDAYSPQALLGRAANRADTLPMEARLLQNDQLSSAAAEKFLTSKKFDALQRRLTDESARDPLASEMTHLYSKAMRRQLPEGTSLRMQTFACELRLCAGSMRSRDQHQYDAWFSTFSDSKQTPNYAMIDYTVDLGGGSFEHRFVFSNTPDSNAIVIPPASLGRPR